MDVNASWNKFYQAVLQLTDSLRTLGINRMDRVAIMLPNVPQLPISYYAALRLGAPVITLDPDLKGREIAYLLDDSEAKVLIILDKYLMEIEKYIRSHPVLKTKIVLGNSIPNGTYSLANAITKGKLDMTASDVDDDDLAVIQYTAGVTGSPKGVMLSQANIAFAVEAARETLKVTEDDIILGAESLCRSLGQHLVMNLSVVTGARMDLLPKFEIDSIHNKLINDKVTLFPTVHSTFKKILDANEDKLTPKHPARMCLSVGGTIDDEVLKQFETEFETYILEGYSLTETCSVAAYNQWRTGRRVNSLGHPIPGIDMKIVNEKGAELALGETGEIVVRGGSVMKGYLNRPRTTAETLIDGWFRTGDLGKMDVNGFFYLFDRMHHRIMKGGFSVYPSEIEKVILEHPDVEDVAVIPVPDEVFGQEIKACIITTEDSLVTTEDIAAYCYERLAAYKVPGVIRFYKDFPKLSNGKIDKAELA